MAEMLVVLFRVRRRAEATSFEAMPELMDNFGVLLFKFFFFKFLLRYFA